MTARSRLALLGLTLLGLGATGYAAYVHLQLLQNAAFISPCDINDTVSCSQVYRSPYGSVQGLPVALLGFCWFAAVLWLQVSARVSRVPQPDHVSAYAFILSIPALAVALYLAYAAFFVLKAVCPLCVITDLAIIGIFILSGMITRFSLTTLPARLTRDLRTLATSPLALALLLLFVAGAASALAFFPREGATATVAATPVVDGASTAAAQTPAASTPASGSQTPAAPAAPTAAQASELEHFLDTAPRAVIPVDVSAPVIIVKFNDYQCPPCRQTYEMYKPLKAKWEREAPGKVKWVNKDFPLEPECNAGLRNAVHQFACEAAASVRMAQANGKGEALEDWIFANQASLSLGGLKKAVQDIGGVPDFDAKYATVLTQVKGDTALGSVLGVGQTPTFYINGVKVPALQTEFMDQAIAYELKKASK